ncbi:MAG: hypothetical protein ABR881_15165 [Candidatus Sulfotelmatobacter sp.]|jgi:hypothetical protein
MDGKKMSNPIAYRKPDVVILGSVAEITGGTHIKGHTGIIEAVQWHMQPVYDLDE